MAKIPFELKWKPQIESGEYKLETECGHPVSIMDWEWIDRNEEKCLAVKVLMDEGFNMGFLFNYDGKRHSIFPTDSDLDLFIITPEPELSEFELKLLDWLSSDTCGEIPMDEMKKCVKNRAAELLELAKKEIMDGWSHGLRDTQDFSGKAYNDGYNLGIEIGYERGKAEALKDLPRWKSDNLPTGSAALDISALCGFDFIRRAGRIVGISSLEKLPGFKED